MITVNTRRLVVNKAADRYIEAERRLWAKVPRYVRWIPGRRLPLAFRISEIAERLAMMRAEKLKRKYGLIK